jgi:hypothetical protein
MWRHGDLAVRMTPFGDKLRWVDDHLNYRGAECLVFPFLRHKDGRGRLRIDGKDIFVHVYVCRRVHGEKQSPEHEVRHLCGNGHHGCMAPAHLAWGTRKQNAEDRLIHGTHAR